MPSQPVTTPGPIDRLLDVAAVLIVAFGIALIYHSPSLESRGWPLLFLGNVFLLRFAFLRDLKGLIVGQIPLLATTACMFARHMVTLCAAT